MVVIITPRGGEVWGAKHVISWYPQEGNITYDVEFSHNDGGTWKVIASKITGTSYTHDFSDEPDSDLCLIRIRSHNGWVYGPYGYSNRFSIKHNLPPTKPTNLQPSSILVDCSQVIRCSWRHNSPYGGEQSRFDLFYSRNQTTWNQISRTTPDQFYYFPADFFADGEKVYWAVRTFDQYDVASPRSDQAAFTTAKPLGVPLILEPIDTIPISRPNILWSAPGQTSYQAQVLLGQEVVWDSGEVVGAAQSVQVGEDLENGKTYTFRVRIKTDAWTDWATTTQLVAYTPPAQPSLSLTEGNGYVEIKTINPTPAQLEVLYNSIYRREQGSWVRIATNILSNGRYRDYNVAANTEYDYKIRAHGINGTSIESEARKARISIRGIWIHSVKDNTSVNIPYNRDIRTTWEPTKGLHSFVGKTFPYVEFGEHEHLSYEVTITTPDEEDKTWFPRLQSLVKRKEILCVRDFRGRKVFGVPESFDESQLFFGNEIPLRITAVDYSEVV